MLLYHEKYKRKSKLIRTLCFFKLFNLYICENYNKLNNFDVAYSIDLT